MILAILFLQTATAQSILDDAWRQIDTANSITVTLIKTSEEFKREHSIKYSWRKGGYFRAEDGPIIDVGDLKHGYTYSTSKKIYQVRTPLTPDETIASDIGADIFHSGWKVLAGPTVVTWHKMKALRIELDGTSLTKETKLFVFVDPTSHSPLGVSANLGSVTQVSIYKDLKINPAIPDNVFQFTPPKGWKEVTEKTGGWK